MTDAQPPRTLALFGASGATGREATAAALARGWHVRGLVRRAGSMGEPRPGMVEIVGDLDDGEALTEVVSGADAVMITLGQRPPYSDVFCAAATRSIVAAARDAGVGRLVCLTGAMIGDYPANRRWLFRRLTRIVARRMPDVMQDRVAQEAAVRESGLRWTLVKPPRLTAGPRTGRIEAGPDLRIGLRAEISRKDLSEALLNACEEDGPQGLRFVRRR